MTNKMNDIVRRRNKIKIKDGTLLSITEKLTHDAGRYFEKVMNDITSDPSIKETSKDGVISVFLMSFSFELIKNVLEDLNCTEKYMSISSYKEYINIMIDDYLREQ